MEVNLSDAAWEAIYARYDVCTYQAALEMLQPEDVVLDIGAGDLHFSRQMARAVKKVYAFEINASALQHGLTSRELLPNHLIPLCVDARALDFPTDTTVGVLLMRHCTHVRLYAEKLRMAGAGRLITNARWHMGVEAIDLNIKRESFSEVGMGWYACWCGRIGFKPGPAEQWSTEMDKVIHEVTDCPQCR